ncbi:MAG TPA: ribose-5-phosphate isomerase RpiA [Blastocatellia bacterium]|jgi:ribose 5-phosphate isomerase A|nr:ribose-5-phosphate isomerase RpiA [Blastocatellia bacterium]
MKEESKRLAAEKASEFVTDGQVVGLGTGSTAAIAIRALASRIQHGLRITGVPTSRASEDLARSLNIPLVELNEVEKVDILIDGADEVNPDFDMIKGGGGALAREKLVALCADLKVYAVDDSKLVDRLGRAFAVPVEVLPFGWQLSARRLREIGCDAQLRGGAAPLITDNGNYILDCRFHDLTNPAEIERAIKLVPGVVESGIFIGIADLLVVGFDGRVEVRQKAPGTT